jgi:hypothetical protein
MRNILNCLEPFRFAVEATSIHDSDLLISSISKIIIVETSEEKCVLAEEIQGEGNVDVIVEYSKKYLHGF